MQKENKYSITQSYYICSNSIYAKEYEEGFILFKARERGVVDEYKGWYLSPLSRKKTSCYDVYAVIKNILQGKIAGIEEINQITFRFSKDYLSAIIYSQDTDEKIFKKLASWYSK